MRLGLALLAGSLLVALTLVLDRARRESIETTREVTAVGDAAFIAPPGQGDFAKPLVTLHGQPLHAAGARTVRLRDTKMVRAGMDDTGKYSVYSTRESWPPGEASAAQKPSDALFLKTGEGEYLEVSTTPLR